MNERKREKSCFLIGRIQSSEKKEIDRNEGHDLIEFFFRLLIHSFSSLSSINAKKKK
jgi:hypothetical protein